ncbi:MAG: TRAP transporter small permease [Kiritimatiellae bacterium]|nr:TRAP transporter small permease [Kiritimatiellia bacterium]
MSRWLTGQSVTSGFLRRVLLALALVGAAAVLAMMLVTVADVVGRQFGLPVPGAYDLVQVLGAIAILCALPLTTAVKGHIAIEYFFQKLARPGRAAVDGLLRLLLLALWIVLAVQFALKGELYRQSHELTATLHMPMFWALWLAAAASALTACVTLWHLLHPGRQMMRPRS